MSEPLVYLSYPSNSTCCSFPADYPSFVYDEFYDVEDLRKS